MSIFGDIQKTVESSTDKPKGLLNTDVKNGGGYNKNEVRYILVDFNHVCIKYIMMDALSTPVRVNGVTQQINTTVLTHATKSIYNMSGRGKHLIGVCLEGAYGSARRRDFFRQIPGNEGYKSGRKKFKGDFYAQMELTTNILHKGGVSLYRDQSMEADDCIYSLVKKLKEQGVTNKIDVITNDADLLPLVDDQVSVYMRAKIEHTDGRSPKLRGYYQVTPETWEGFMEHRSEFKEFIIPYNSIALYKMIRGDNSDKVKGALKGYGKVRYNKLMHEMINDGVDFEKVFRYSNNFVEDIQPVLLKYFEQETVDHMHVLFMGFSPFEADFVTPERILHGELQLALAPFQVNLPLP